MPHPTPHDALFKAMMSQPGEAAALIRGFLPAHLSNQLDLSTLELDNSAYISEDLREYFSDVVYLCHWKATDQGTSPAQVVLLFEHKSYLPGNVYIQLLRYLTESYQHQDQETPPVRPLRLVVPIVVYHGEDTWKLRSFESYFNLPDRSFKRYLPLFDYELVDIPTVPDEAILEAEDDTATGFFLRSTFLLFKYRKNKDAFLQLSKKIFIFVERDDIPEEVKSQVVTQFIIYILTVYILKKTELETLKKSMPAMTQYVPGSLWEQALLEGEAKGEAKGEARGEAKEKLITTIEDDLGLLARMRAQNLGLELMRTLSQVPEAILQEFSAAYTAKKAEKLLAHVRQARELSELDVVRQHLLEGLVFFGFTDDVARAYVPEPDASSE